VSRINKIDPIRDIGFCEHGSLEWAVKPICYLRLRFGIDFLVDVKERQPNGVQDSGRIIRMTNTDPINVFEWTQEVNEAGQVILPADILLDILTSKDGNPRAEAGLDGAMPGILERVDGRHYRSDW